MSKFFIDRPIVAMVISILFVLGGLVAMSTLPIAQFPQITPPQVQITSSYQGADALTVETAVAAPIEQAMNGVEQMLYMQSTNAGDGTMTLRVTFDVDSNVNIDSVLTQNRLTEATPFLPQDVRALGITARKVSTSALLVVSVSSTDDRYSPEFLANYVTINMRDALLRVPGVGDMRVFGASDYAMRIWVKPDELTRLGLTVTDLQNAIRSQNVVNPAGQIGAEPAPPGTDLTYSARAQGRLETAEQFGAVVVRALPDGSLVRLRDVARVELGSQLYRQRARFDGRPAAAFGIYQVPGTNALDVARGVETQLEELKARFPRRWSTGSRSTPPPRSPRGSARSRSPWWRRSRS